MKWGIMVMKSKTSFYNRGILRNDFKSFGWISAAYLLILFLVVPLQVLMLHSREQNNSILDKFAYLQVFMYGESVFLTMSIVVVPIVTGVLLFRYLQANKIADMIHALPVQRETVYNTHFLSGFIFLSVPLAVTALLSWALAGWLGIEQVSGLFVLKWLGTSLLLNLVFYAATVFTGIFTGLSTLQAILTLILLILPSGLLELLRLTGVIYIYGFTGYYFLSGSTFSPLIRIADLNLKPLRSGEVIIYLLMIIALYLIGKYFYGRRQVERAGSAITFNALHPVFKYGVTFCFMLFVGVYFYQTQNSKTWLYFGYLLASLLAFFLIEMLLNKSLRVFHARTFKQYGLYLVVMLLLLAAVSSDFTGYEKRVPALSEVKSIYMDQAGYYDPAAYAISVPYTHDNVDTMVKPQPAFYTDRANIARIAALHRSIVDNRKRDEVARNACKNIRDQETVYFIYTMKNGDSIYRQYSLPVQEYKALLKPINESMEFKKFHNDILSIKPKQVEIMSIDAYQSDKHITVADPQLVSQAILALQKDICQQKYEDMRADITPWANLTLFDDRHRTISLTWNKSYTNFEQWLMKSGKIQEARLIPQDDIAFAVVDKGINYEELNRTMPTIEVVQLLAKKSGVLMITNPDQLEKCLHNFGSPENDYVVYFQLNNGSVVVGGFNEDTAPDFVKSHFVSK